MEELLNLFPGKFNQHLLLWAIFFGALAVISIVLMTTDSRELMGVNIWLKTLKFCVSIAIFLATSAYLIEVLPYPPAKRTILVWLLVGTMLIEIGCIFLQAYRGQLSHFNITDPLGSILFPIMGFAIATTYLTYLWILVDFIRLETNLSTTVYWAIVIGIIIFLFGGVSGFMMAGRLGHNVGVADGGAGLPFTNWSTVAGDLRVSHFFSIHAILLLPLFALVISKLSQSTLMQVSTVIAMGAAYLLFSVFTFIQAIHGQPFIRLD